MTIWWVHRPNGPGTPIAWAGQYAQPGYADEQLDDTISTELQTFLNPPPTPQQQRDQKAAQGIAITSLTAPVLNATYALDPVTLDQIGSVARDTAAGLGLPGGAVIFTYPDINSVPCTFTEPQIQGLYKAMRDLVFQLDMTAAQLQAGAAVTWPVQAATIP